MMSPSCLPDVLSQPSPTCGLPSVSVSASCLPDVSQMWSPNCFPELSSTIPSCPPELVFQLSLSVFHLSPIVSHLSRLSCKCGLPIVSQLSSTCLPQRPIVSQMWFPNYFPIASTCFPVTSQMWSKSLPIAYRSLEFEPVTAVGLQSRVIFLL